MGDRCGASDDAGVRVCLPGTGWVWDCAWWGDGGWSVGGAYPCGCLSRTAASRILLALRARRTRFRPVGLSGPVQAFKSGAGDAHINTGRDLKTITGTRHSLLLLGDGRTGAMVQKLSCMRDDSQEGIQHYHQTISLGGHVLPREGIDQGVQAMTPWLPPYSVVSGRTRAEDIVVARKRKHW